MKYTVVFGKNEKQFSKLIDAIDFAMKLEGIADIFYGDATHVATYMSGQDKTT